MKIEKLYEIWMRNYPQPDVNISEEWEIPPCKSLKKAKELCEELEANYADEGWKGNRLYKTKFYPQEVQ